MAEDELVPKPRYQVSGGPPGGPPSPDRGDADSERDYFTAEERALQQAEQERAFQISRFEQNILNRTPRKETVRWATREVMGRKESVTVASPTLEDRYGMLNLYQGMRSRASALTAGRDEGLIDYLGFREDGIAVHRFKPLEVDQSKGRIERQAEAKRLLQEHEKLSEDEIAQRNAIIAELERAADEIEVREKFDDLWGLYLFVQGNFREFRRIPFAAVNKLPVARDFKTLFDLPATAEAGWENVPEAHKERMEGKVGERVDLGIRLYAIAALSERPDELREIRNTPGYQDFVLKPLEETLDRLIERDSRGGLEESEFRANLRRLVGKYGKDPEKVFIGEIDRWKREEARLRDGPESETERMENRGLLTMHGNFFARKERWDQKEEINEAVMIVLGGDKTAQELARRMFYMVGLAPYYGTERDKTKYNEEGEIVRQEVDREGAPFSDARERAMDLDAFMRYKQKNGEWGGPDFALGKYPKRLLTNFFRHVSVTNPEIKEKLKRPGLSKEEKEKLEWEEYLSSRSIWELMWDGWDGERALRLGEVPWERLKSFAWKDYSIRLVFSAQLFDILTGNTEERGAWNLRNFTSVKWWREYATAARVSLGSWTVTDGLNRKWFEENMGEIEARAREVPRDEETRTEEGAKKKAATDLLKEQTRGEIVKTHEALADAIYWWYGNIEDLPPEGHGLYDKMNKKIGRRRRRAGVLLLGEKKDPFTATKRKDS